MSITENQMQLTHEEEDIIGEVLNISMGAAATAISVMINRQVNITTPVVENINKDEFSYKEFEPAVGVEISYIEGLHGSNLLIISAADVKAIVGTLMDSEPTDGEELSDIHLSALGEIMNQMVGSSSTALASFYDKKINISTPRIIEPDVFYNDFMDSQECSTIVTVKFRLYIEGLIDSRFVTVLPLAFAREIIDNADNFDKSKAVEQESIFGETVKGHTQIHRPIFAQEQKPSAPKNTPAKQFREASKHEQSADSVSVQNVNLISFDEEKVNDTLEQMNLDLVMDVEVAVTVEIGHTKKQVKDVLNIAKGSIIQLDRQAGDPVDVIVNGRLIAKGDIVVIDDNFGVRITSILSGK